MPLFITKDHNGIATGIYSSKTIESLNAFLQGKNDLPYKIETFDMNKIRENEEMGYVTTLITTEEKEIYDFSRNPRTCRIVTK